MRRIETSEETRLRLQQEAKASFDQSVAHTRSAFSFENAKERYGRELERISAFSDADLNGRAYLAPA